MLHTIVNALVALLGFAAMAGVRLLISPRFHRAIQRKIRNRAIGEMERNLALFDTTSAARQSIGPRLP